MFIIVVLVCPWKFAVLVSSIEVVNGRVSMLLERSPKRFFGIQLSSTSFGSSAGRPKAVPR